MKGVIMKGYPVRSKLKGENHRLTKEKKGKQNIEKTYFPRIANVIFPEFNLTKKSTSNIVPLQYLVDSI